MLSKSGLFAVLMCIALAGCSGAKDTASEALDTVGNESSASFDKLRDDLDLGHKSKPEVVKAAQPRYCYHTYEDIICYSKPLPGEEYRLVGFQTAKGKTGYTMSPTPVPGGAATDNTASAPTQSANVATPPSAKSDDKQLKEIIFDPAELQPKELVPDKPQ